MRCRIVQPMKLSTREAAALLGISESGVRKLDAILKPTRLVDGNRRYAAATVERVREARARKKAPMASRRDRILARVDHRGARK